MNETVNKDVLTKMATAIRTTPLGLFELMYYNNPVSLNSSLRNHNLTSAVNIDESIITQVVNRLIMVRDKNLIYSVVQDVLYNPNSPQDWTTSNLLWSMINANGKYPISKGSFLDIFNNLKNIS